MSAGDLRAVSWVQTPIRGSPSEKARTAQSAPTEGPLINSCLFAVFICFNTERFKTLSATLPTFIHCLSASFTASAVLQPPEVL